MYVHISYVSGVARVNVVAVGRLFATPGKHERCVVYDTPLGLL